MRAGGLKIAVIGGGEVGRSYAEALAVRTSHEVTVCDPQPREELYKLAESGGVVLNQKAGPWLAEMDRVWLCVTGDIAPNVVADLVPLMKPGATLVDLTTATPEAKRTSFAVAQEHGTDYVDAVILGAVALTQARTPLLAAGENADRAMAEFVELGAPVKTLPLAKAGDAAALKLLRTILTKGLEALSVECLVAAEQQGVRAELYEAMSDIDRTGFTNFLDMLVTTHVQHCGRRLHEVERAQEQLMGMDLPASMLAGSRPVFQRTVDARKVAAPPAAASTDVAVALEWLATAAQ